MRQGEEAMVWAIAETHLANYLLPRDCPRVCFRAAPDSNPADVERFLAESGTVVAIEEAWLPKVRNAQLYCYQMPVQDFALYDAIAGYWVSRHPIIPTAVRNLTNLLEEIADLGASLRSVASLWPLHDEIASSSLTFSMIRMRNAAPRP
jgi:hypothetical protein